MALSFHYSISSPLMSPNIHYGQNNFLSVSLAAMPDAVLDWTGVFNWCANRKKISRDCKVKHNDFPCSVLESCRERHLAGPCCIGEVIVANLRSCLH